MRNNKLILSGLMAIVAGCAAPASQRSEAAAARAPSATLGSEAAPTKAPNTTPRTVVARLTLTAGDQVTIELRNLAGDPRSCTVPWDSTADGFGPCIALLQGTLVDGLEIRPGNGVRYGTLATFIDALRTAGVPGVTLADATPSESAGGNLSPEELERAIDEHHVTLSACYTTWIKEAHESPAVSFPVHVTVGADGVVQSAGVDDAPPKPLVDCVIREVRTWRFPKAGGATTFELPVKFVPGG